jgi:hypothetical protein
MQVSSTSSNASLQSDAQTGAMKKAIDTQQQQVTSLLDSSQQQMQQLQQQNTAKITGLGGNLNIMG